MVITVPGNILVAGEYAVLENGGLGFGLAVDRRVKIVRKDSDTLSITTKFGGQEVVYTGKAKQLPLFDAVIKSAQRTLRILGMVHPKFSAKIHIDSSALFAENGDKLGLGSSAAVAVGLAYALLKGQVSEERLLQTVFNTALFAHSDFQGGKGSGYDVAVSTFGGCGLFNGGETPVWVASQPYSFYEKFLIVRGEQPVKSVGSLDKYNRWKEQNIENGTEFLIKSNKIVRHLYKCATYQDFIEWLHVARSNGKSLGAKIGVESCELSLCDKLSELETKGVYGKPSGAGSEIAVAFSKENSYLEDVAYLGEVVNISKEGVLCQK